MLKINDPSDCCGCTACASICPRNAISMKPDALGFLYPVIDEQKCIECGLCEKVCAFNADYDKSDNLKEPLPFAVRNKSIKEVETSRSGGTFIALSDWILEHGGVVYGAGYGDHFRIVHKRADSKVLRDEFKGSKYVQSDLTGIFPSVKRDLKNGLLVLFSGTACQVAGLKSYIGSRYRENLYLADIVCHGVPGPQIWKDYVEYLEKKHKDTIIAVNFRDKQLFGWDAHKETFVFSKKKIKETSNIYFYKSLFFRRSCNNCCFTNLQRPSDITLADFWGWQKVDETLNKDNKGVSLVFINTPKGEKWFSDIKERITYIQAPIEKCMQPNLMHPSEMHPKRIEFEKDYSEKGFLYVMRKYGELNRLYQCRVFASKIKQRLLKFLRA